jgi:hypothetical protein
MNDKERGRNPPKKTFAMSGCFDQLGTGEQDQVFDEMYREMEQRQQSKDLWDDV